MAYPFFTTAVPSPGNFIVMSNGVQAPSTPNSGMDQNLANIIIFPEFLAKLPLSTDGKLAVQFTGWPSFDISRCTYFRFVVNQPDWASGPFLEHVVGTTEFAWSSAIRHFTPDGAAEHFQCLGSYQSNVVLLINPGIYNLTCTIIGADDTGALPAETSLEPQP